MVEHSSDELTVMAVDWSKRLTYQKKKKMWRIVSHLSHRRVRFAKKNAAGPVENEMRNSEVHNVLVENAAYEYSAALEEMDV